MLLPKELPADTAQGIGAWGSWPRGQLVVERGFLDHWCEVFEDKNPAYSDDAYAATSRYGTRIAPSVAGMALNYPYAWRSPSVEQRLRERAGWVPPHVLLRQRYQLGGSIATSLQLEAHRPIRLGDRVDGRRRVTAIGELRKTAVGQGYTVLHEIEHRNQDNAFVGSIRLATFMYRATPRPVELLRGFIPDLQTDLSQYELPPSALGEGPLETLMFRNSLVTMYRVASAVRDWNVFHVDSQYVRVHAGLADKFNSINCHMALLSRFATDWSGPDWHLRNLEMDIGGLVHPGDTIRVEGVVVRRYRLQYEQRVELSAVMRTDQRTVMSANITLVQP